ncbi:hypothetical protein ACHQM5_012804 [Ranunculus cassubicifolius]
MSCALNLTEDDTSYPYWDEKVKERLPANFLNRLVSYGFRYSGMHDECEFELMKFIVENATALRNINIFHKFGVVINKELVFQKLKTYSPNGASQLNVLIHRGF